MTLNIDISKDVIERLKERAASLGLDVATYAAGVLRRAAEQPRPISEISGPIAEAFKQTGMSDDELGDALERAKHDMRKRKRAS